MAYPVTSLPSYTLGSSHGGPGRLDLNPVWAGGILLLACSVVRITQQAKGDTEGGMLAKVKQTAKRGAKSSGMTEIQISCIGILPVLCPWEEN